MKNFKEFINEGLLAAMKPKPEEDILKKLKGLSVSDRIKVIIINKLDYDLLPEKREFDGNLDCSYNGLTSLPDGLLVNGSLHCYNNELDKLPDDLVVNGVLNCSGNNLTSLPDDLVVNDFLICSFNKLPNDTKKPIGVKGKMLI